MSNTATSLEIQAKQAQTAGDATGGWYLYGITRRGNLESALADADNADSLGPEPMAASTQVAPVQLLEFAALAAVVRPVFLADFSQAVLHERLQSAPALEAMVRSHNRVIEAIHGQQAILPAKFGSVYVRAEDVVSALRQAHDVFLRQLHRLEGRDEFAVHLYADRAVIAERISAEDPAIQRMRDERAMARPGRAYFLDRQITAELEAATQRALVALAQDVFDRLAAHSVAGHMNPAGQANEAVGEVEILRACFLVGRERAHHFVAEVGSCTAAEGLRSEFSGPWPPYSFTNQDDVEA